MDGRSALCWGLGPVFAYEWIALSRRWQWYALRSVFAVALLAALLVILSRSHIPLATMTVAELATLAESFFVAAVGTQLTLVLLAAPAATAGSICLDRASGKLTLMLVTDLASPEIVLGKLAARLVPVLGLVGCALPLLALLMLLGGVDPAALLGAFLVTVGVAVLGCSLALALSLWASRTHEALLGTYAVWACWLLARPLVGHVNRTFGTALPLPAQVADPFYLAFSPYWNPSSASIAEYAWFLAATLGASAALAAAAILRLRAVCTRVVVARKDSLGGRLGKAFARLDPTRRLPGPTLDFNPVLWREWHRARPSRWGRAVAGLFVVAAVVASLGAMLAPATTFAMAWVNGLQVSVGMLLLSVTAATSLAEERARGSLDVLMATTLTTREIVVGKWLGTFRKVPWLAVLPTAVIACSDRSKTCYLASVVLTLVFVLICGAAITGLGLAMATWSARLGRAVGLTVSCYVLLAVGWMFLWIPSGPISEGPMMASPFFFVGELAADQCGMSERRHVGWAVFWLFIHATAAVAFLVATLATFNRRLGRVESGARRLRRPPACPT